MDNSNQMNFKNFSESAFRDVWNHRANEAILATDTCTVLGMQLFRVS